MDDGSHGLGGDVDELVGRPCVAVGPFVVGIVDPADRFGEGLGPREVAVSDG